jgi:preprotein translocase subunit YajC
MFTTSALAQATTGVPGAGDFIGMIVPLVAIMGVFYFLMIRPQQRKAKEHQNLITQISRGDTVVTHGGLIGKVFRVVDDNELLVEIGENVKVRVLRQGIADVRAKGEPMKAEPVVSSPVKNKKK